MKKLFHFMHLEIWTKVPTLSHFQRCQRYSMKIGLRKMHERGSPQSACPMHAGNLVLKRGENKFFWEVTVAWAKAYGQARGYVSDAIHRFLHNFNVDSCGYSASIRSRSPLDVPYHCSFTQPNTCIRSLASRAAGIPLSYTCMRTSSWIMDGQCQELPAYLACAA